MKQKIKKKKHREKSKNFKPCNAPVNTFVFLLLCSHRLIPAQILVTCVRS